MRIAYPGLFAAIAYQLGPIAAAYVPLREYAGATFFDGWDYWGNVDNTTWGESEIEHWLVSARFLNSTRQKGT